MLKSTRRGAQSKTSDLNNSRFKEVLSLVHIEASHEREVLSELPLSSGLPQSCQWYMQVAPLYQETLPTAYTTRMVSAWFWLSATSPQAWLRSCLCCGDPWTGEGCSQGWPYRAGTCVCPLWPPPVCHCRNELLDVKTCSDLAAPILTSASISLLVLFLLFLWRSAEVNTHVWKQNSLYVASVAYWHGTAQ